MKKYSFGFFLKQGFQGLWRNGVMTFVSITVLMSCLVVLGSFAMLLFNVEYNLESLGQLNEIVVFADYDLSEEELVTLENELSSLENVSSVTRVTKEEVLNRIKESAAGSTAYDDINEENNPLSDEFVITYENNEQATTLVYKLDQIKQEGRGVRSVQNRLDLAATLESFKHTILLVFAWFLLLLLLICMFVIINTIKLSVYARRTEITVMRYVGATNTFITLPFVFEGVMIGSVASVVAFFVQKILYGYVHTAVDQAQLFVRTLPFADLAWPFFGAFLAVGLVTGIIGSCISLRRFLRS